MSDTAAAAAAARRLGPADALVAGMLDLASARSLALDALVSVAAVEWSADIATACVECADRPRLLLNPVFVERWCGTRERLAMLVLHELSHISLGHTRLYARLTPTHNVAFDAVINAALLVDLHQRRLDAREYGALCMDFYEADVSPWFLLRPPPGWPDRPRWDTSAACPPVLRDVHRRLYQRAATPGPAGLLGVTYGEIVAALESEASRAQGGAAGSSLVARLLGAHAATDRERSATTSGRDAHAAEALAGVLERLGIERTARAPGKGGDAQWLELERRERERTLEQALSRLLRKALVDVTDGMPRWHEDPVPTMSVDPTHDRRAAVRRYAARLLGAPSPLLFRSRIVRRRPERRAAAIYVDVSGSMDGQIERLHAALVPLRRLLSAKIYAFSTEVVELSRAEFVRGRVRTTWGTDIEPVVRHFVAMAAHGTVRRAVVLTDGYVGAPKPEAIHALAAAGGELHFGVIGTGPLLEREPWVASATRLPDPLRPPTTSPSQA